MEPVLDGRQYSSSWCSDYFYLHYVSEWSRYQMDGSNHNKYQIIWVQPTIINHPLLALLYHYIPSTSIILFYLTDIHTLQSNLLLNLTVYGEKALLGVVNAHLYNSSKFKLAFNWHGIYLEFGISNFSVPLYQVKFFFVVLLFIQCKFPVFGFTSERSCFL